MASTTSMYPSARRPARQLWTLSCVFFESLRQDFLISRTTRLRLIVNLEPGPFEVHG
jgi:hypothetical protein